MCCWTIDTQILFSSLHAALFILHKPKLLETRSFCQEKSFERRIILSYTFNFSFLKKCWFVALRWRSSNWRMSVRETDNVHLDFLLGSVRRNSSRNSKKSLKYKASQSLSPSLEGTLDRCATKATSPLARQRWLYAQQTLSKGYFPKEFSTRVVSLYFTFVDGFGIKLKTELNYRVAREDIGVWGIFLTGFSAFPESFCFFLFSKTKL